MLALSVIVVAVPAQAGLHTPSATLTIRLTSTAADARFLIDRVPKGYPNTGDVVRETSTMRNAIAQFGRPKGAVVGHDTWLVTFVIPPLTKLEVKATARLPGGTIRAAGTISGVQTTGTLHVVGGTGSYAQARGTVSMRNLNTSGSRGLNVYRLQLP